jgi:hypothetical protein
MIQATPDHPSWASVAITTWNILLGAIMGFGFGRLTDRLNERKVRGAFLKAIRIELKTVREDLNGTLTEATVAKKSVESGDGWVLHLAAAFQSVIYVSQLGKLRDVSAPLIIEVIRFYDRLSNLEKIKSNATSSSIELARLTGAGEDVQKEKPIVAFYVSSLDEVIKRISELIPIADRLIANLPE